MDDSELGSHLVEHLRDHLEAPEPLCTVCRRILAHLYAWDRRDA